MEQQFILRLPDSLQKIDTKLAKITRINQKEVQFCYNNIIYPGVICKLPTILDSHKFIDNKLYKIADISTLIVIYEKKCENIDEEILKHEKNGISPPTYRIKDRRSRDNVIKPADVEMIEKKIADLLKEDSKAFKVDFKHLEKENSDDIDMLAAEIEGKMLSDEGQNKDQIFDNKKSIKNIDSLDANHEQFVKNSTMDPQINTKSLQKDNIEKDMSLIDEINQELICSMQSLKEVDRNVNDPLLIELNNKIKEKEDALNRTLNPILKKRFEQTISELKEEYEKRKKELGN